MADSKRLKVQKALTARLENITVAGGYQHDLVGSVFRGRPDFGDETKPPFVAIFEVRPEDYPVRADETNQKDVWILGVQGFVKADDIHPTDPAHNLMADIKKSLAQVMTPGHPGNRNPNYMFGNLVSDMRVDGGVTYVHAEHQGVAVCILKLTLEIAEDLENIYE